MTPRSTGALVAVALAAGLLAGSAATIVVREASAPDLATVMADHRDDMGVMGSMMSGGMPSASLMPGSLHDQHHPKATP